MVGWGNNNVGQLNVPAKLTNVIAVAAGAKHTLALKADGTVIGWGSPEMGLKYPPAGLTNVIAIATGLSNSLALKADGSVVAWGSNYFGPVPAPPGLSNIVAICGGFLDRLALRADGVLFGWGRQPTLAVLQTNVVAGSQNLALAQGMTHCLALAPDGRVLAWGDNGYGQCDVPEDLTNAIAVAGGNGYSMAICEDGTVRSWGNPVSIPTSATNVVAITVTSDNRWFLRADGTVVNGNTGTPVNGLTNVLAISSGVSHTVALISDNLPASQPAALGVALTGDQLQVVVPTQSGRVYRLEQSGSLSGTNWAPLRLAPGNGSAQTLIDPTPTNSMGFYRIRQW